MEICEDKTWMEMAYYIQQVGFCISSVEISGSVIRVSVFMLKG